MERRYALAAESITRWRENLAYLRRPTRTILLTANMSAGKSTLLNALVGKQISKTQNAACTAKCHYIYSKAFEDGFNYEYDYLLDLNADQETLMNDNSDNPGHIISVGTAFRLVCPPRTKLCLLDTPGVNSAMNTQHQQITRDAIEGASYDTVLYVMNGENIGTTDDWRYLAYLKERIRTKRMIFVVNKLDRFKQGEDSVEDTLHKAGEDVEKAGFTDYLLCPISAYAAFLAKKQLWGEPLDQEEQDELTYFTLKFKNQAFDLGRFCPLPEPVAAAVKGGCREKQQEVLVDILLKSGVAGLEFQLTQ